MSIMDEAQFDFELPPLTPKHNSWYSTSKEGFSQIDPLNSSSLNISSPSAQTPFTDRHSAFTAYIKAGPKAAFEFSGGGHILHKRCFRFLSAIQKKKELAMHMPAVDAPAGDNKHHKSRTDWKFEHRMAERTRRSRLKQHLSNLYSLLPKKSKRDKFSILANTTSYLKELKLHVAELEEQNQNLSKLIPKSFSNKSEECNKVP